ncbi:uncharacterized protein [Temnothorax nylanderi]|uniref:uncharacterized protein isoform X4 n=1 Tax=Temnothorax nylanderi TaxID=102681 RepID=UPI003A889044
MDVEEGEAKMCRLCGQYEKIYIGVFEEEGVRRYLGTKIHKINILIHKDDALPQQICASCVDKLDFVCDFYDSCHVIQERLWWLIESSKNQRQEIQKQPADYQTNEGDDPTQEGVTLGTEYSTEYSNIIIKEECLPDLNLELYPSNQGTQKQPAGYQTNKGDDPTQEEVTLGTEYSTEYSNIINKKECLPDLNLDMYPSNQETREQPASYQTNKGDDPMQEGVTLGTEYSTEYSNIIIKEECLPDLNLELYPSNQETQKQPASYQTNKGDNPMQSDLESKFKCPKCPNVYKRKQNLNEHLLKHEDIKKNFPCDTCGEIFNSHVKMRIHMRRHKSNSVACEICRYHLSSKEALERHHKKVHLHDYVCDICHKKVISKKILRAHIISHLESKFKCPKCPNVYKSKHNLNEHLLKHEGIKKSHLESKFKCPKCPNVYKQKHNLNEHLLKHEDIKKNFPCDTCGEIFHSHVRLRVHMQRHKSNSVACEICRYHLSSKEALEKHHRTVHLHDYVCDICHKKLKSKRKLRDHIISHLESKFKCPKCPNVYKWKRNLNEHLLKHEGICKYECSICKKTYGHRSHLTRHQKVHSEPR